MARMFLAGHSPCKIVPTLLLSCIGAPSFVVLEFSINIDDVTRDFFLYPFLEYFSDSFRFGHLGRGLSQGETAECISRIWRLKQMPYHIKTKKIKEGWYSKVAMNRRSFLKGAAVASLGVAGVGMMPGCSPKSPDEAKGSVVAEANENVRQAIATQLNPQDDDFRGNSGDLSTLFSPLAIGGLTIDCRMVKSSAGSNTFIPGKESAVAYYSKFAKGGVPLVWIESTCSWSEHFPQVPLKKTFEERKESIQAVVDAIHAEGKYAGYQIDTMSNSLSKRAGQSQLISSGDSRGFTTDLMTLDEIKLLVQDHVNFAKELKALGVDAFEINAAGNNTPQAFLSRYRNLRDDEYGPQSIENRCRLLTDIIKGVREECGPDWPIQVLINGIEENDQVIGDNTEFTTVEEGVAIAKELEKAGLSSLHVRLGPSGMHIAQFAGDLMFAGRGINGSTGYGTQFDFERHYQGKLVANHYGAGLMLNVSKMYKDALDIPVGTVTYMDPAYAPDYFEQALKDGMVDFFIMNRPLTVDPEYVNKLREGRFDEIAPCCRCMHCYSDTARDGSSVRHCRVNAATQRAYYEDKLPEGYELPAKEGDKKVMVVGAGPGGMEAARVAAQRGYEVSLYEKKDSVGGLLPFASTIKGPRERLDDLTAYLKRQLELTGVKLITGTEVTVDLVKDQQPDVLIVATGGVRESTGLEGTAGTSIVSIDDIASAEIGQNVTVVGCNVQAVDVTLYLLEQGKSVSMVFPDAVDQLGKGQSAQVKLFVDPMLRARGVRLWPESQISVVGDGEITVDTKSGVTVSYACDTVIEALDMAENTALAQAAEGIADVRMVGCDAPYNILESICAGNLAARRI